MELPPLNRESLLHVDMTPDKDLPLRILRAYIENCKVQWVVKGLPKGAKAVYDAMNKHQAQRAKILEEALQKLS